MTGDRYRFRIQFHGPLRGYRVTHGPKGQSRLYNLPGMVRIDTLVSAMAYCVTIANEKQLGSYSIKVDPPAVTFE